MWECSKHMQEKTDENGFAFFKKSQFVAFFFHQSKLISTQLSTDAELTLGLLPAGSRPRTKSVVVPGLLSLCLCQHSKYSPSIISIDLQ